MRVGTILLLIFLKGVMVKCIVFLFETVEVYVLLQVMSSIKRLMLCKQAIWSNLDGDDDDNTR